MHSMGFNALNIIWLLITITAIVQIRKKRIIRHRNWMIRSYAFCFTNMGIHLITSLCHQGFGLDYAAAIPLAFTAPLYYIPDRQQNGYRSIQIDD